MHSQLSKQWQLQQQSGVCHQVTGMCPWLPGTLRLYIFLDMPFGKLSEGDLKGMVQKCCIVRIKAGAI